MKPVVTEKAVMLIELQNTIVFELPMTANKQFVKNEVEELFKVKVESIRSLIKKNKKYFYVKLNKNNPAVDIATKLGII